MNYKNYLRVFLVLTIMSAFPAVICAGEIFTNTIPLEVANPDSFQPTQVIWFDHPDQTEGMFKADEGKITIDGVEVNVKEYFKDLFVLPGVVADSNVAYGAKTQGVILADIFGGDNALIPDLDLMFSGIASKPYENGFPAFPIDEPGQYFANPFYVDGELVGFVVAARNIIKWKGMAPSSYYFLSPISFLRFNDNAEAPKTLGYLNQFQLKPITATQDPKEEDIKIADLVMKYPTDVLTVDINSENVNEEDGKKLPEVVAINEGWYSGKIREGFLTNYTLKKMPVAETDVVNFVKFTKLPIGSRPTDMVAVGSHVFVAVNNPVLVAKDGVLQPEQFRYYIYDVWYENEKLVKRGIEVPQPKTPDGLSTGLGLYKLVAGKFNNDACMDLAVIWMRSQMKAGEASAEIFDSGKYPNKFANIFTVLLRGNENGVCLDTYKSFNYEVPTTIDGKAVTPQLSTIITADIDEDEILDIVLGDKTVYPDDSSVYAYVVFGNGSNGIPDNGTFDSTASGIKMLKVNNAPATMYGVNDLSFDKNLAVSIGPMMEYLPVDCGVRDKDQDGIYDDCDNCAPDEFNTSPENAANYANPDQLNSDFDFGGDVCDPKKEFYFDDKDKDGDGIIDEADVNSDPAAGGKEAFNKFYEGDDSSDSDDSESDFAVNYKPDTVYGMHGVIATAQNLTLAVSTTPTVEVATSKISELKKTDVKLNINQDIKVGTSLIKPVDKTIVSKPRVISNDPRFIGVPKDVIPGRQTEEPSMGGHLPSAYGKAWDNKMQNLDVTPKIIQKLEMGTQPKLELKMIKDTEVSKLAPQPGQVNVLVKNPKGVLADLDRFCAKNPQDEECRKDCETTPYQERCITADVSAFPAACQINRIDATSIGHVNVIRNANKQFKAITGMPCDKFIGPGGQATVYLNLGLIATGKTVAGSPKAIKGFLQVDDAASMVKGGGAEDPSGKKLGFRLFQISGSEMKNYYGNLTNPTYLSPSINTWSQIYPPLPKGATPQTQKSLASFNEAQLPTVSNFNYNLAVDDGQNFQYSDNSFTYNNVLKTSFIVNADGLIFVAVDIQAPPASCTMPQVCPKEAVKVPIWQRNVSIETVLNNLQPDNTVKTGVYDTLGQYHLGFVFAQSLGSQKTLGEHNSVLHDLAAGVPETKAMIGGVDLNLLPPKATKTAQQSVDAVDYSIGKSVDKFSDAYGIFFDTTVLPENFAISGGGEAGFCTLIKKNSAQPLYLIFFMLLLAPVIVIRLNR